MKFTKKDKLKDGLKNSGITSGIAQNGGTSSDFTGLETHTIWGLEFNGTQDVVGDMTNVGNITASGNIQTDEDIVIKTLDSEGNELDGKDLNISVEGDDADFTGKVNYVFDGKIKADSEEITNDVSVGGNTTLSKNLNVNGNTTVKGNLSVNGNSILKNVSSTNITNTGKITSQTLLVNGDSILNNVTSNNITNSDTIKTKNLEVTGSAHFFELIIDKIKSAGGAAIFTPADGFEIDIVSDEVFYYKLFWRCRDGNGKQRDNMWKVNDLAICMSFNQAQVGTSHNVSNKYYWTLVNEVSDNSNPRLIDGVYYHWIQISKDNYDGTLNPEVGDSIAMLGYRGTDDPSRQSALYISAYKSLDKGLTAPVLAQYQGINDFNLESHRKSYFDATGAKFVGNFEVSSGQSIEDYINSKVNGAESGTPYIGENGNWYVWDPETKKYKDSGISAKGEKGDPGLKGDPGENAGGTSANTVYIFREDKPDKPTFTNIDLPTDGWSRKIFKNTNVTEVNRVYEKNEPDWTNVVGNWGDFEEFEKLEDDMLLGILKWKKYPSFNYYYTDSLSYGTYTFITTEANQNVSFEIKSYTAENSGFIWLSEIDDTTTPTFNLEKLKESDKAVSGNDKSKIITYTVSTPGTHTITASYGTNSPNQKDFVLFRMRYSAWVTSYTPSNKKYWFLLNLEKDNQFNYLLYTFKTTQPNQTVLFEIKDGSFTDGCYTWVNKIDDTTKPTFDIESLKTSDRAVTQMQNKIISDVVKDVGTHSVYFACGRGNTGGSTQSCYGKVRFVDLTLQTLWESTATVENDVVTEWSDPIESTYYTDTISVETAQETNMCDLDGNLYVDDNYIVYRNNGGFKKQIESDFVKLYFKYNNQSCFMCETNMLKNNTYLHYTDTYPDLMYYYVSKPETISLVIIDSNLGYPKVLLLRTLAITYKPGATFTINQNLGEIKSEVTGNYQELKDQVTTNTNNISTITQKADSIESTVESHTKQIDNINGNIKSTRDDVSSITQRADSIESTVTSLKNKVDNMKDGSSTEIDISDLKQRADSIEATVSKHTESISDLDSRVTTNADNISTIKQTADSIESTVKKHTETISDLDGRVTTNTDNISKIKQTADSISSTVESFGDNYVSKSELSQTSDSILALVNNNYIKIGDTNITIGGNTTIEGSLTLTTDDQGFKLVGATGVTEIMPKSIGSYDDFKKENTGNQTFGRHLDCAGGRWILGNVDAVDFLGYDVIKLGDRKKGDYVTVVFNGISASVTNAYDNNLKVFLKTFSVAPTISAKVTNKDNSITYKDFGTIKTGTEYNVTFTQDMEDARIYLTCQSSCAWSSWIGDYQLGLGAALLPMPNCRFYYNGKLGLPTGAHMLIGYDGWAANFGNNTTVYCGADGFIASYGSLVFKITSAGIVGNNRRTVAILSKENYNADEIVYTATTDIDTIIATAKKVSILLPQKPYDGYELKIYDKTKADNGVCYITSSPYPIIMCREWKGEIKKDMELDRFCVRTYTFFVDAWYEGYEGY